MRILTRHLVARFLGYFAAFLIVSTITLVIVEMMLNLGDMLRGGGGLADVTEYLLLRVPAYYLRDVIPIAAFGAAYFTFGTAARWLELLAAKAGGLSPRRIAAPLLATGGVLTACAFLLNETWVLDATRGWNQRDAEAEAESIRFREGSFWYQRGRTIYNIGHADRATSTLRGVQIFELDARGRLLRRIQAPSATLDEDDVFRFEAPRVHRFDPSDRAGAPRIEDHEGPVTLDLAEHTGVALMGADLGALSVRELTEVIAREGEEGRRSERPRALLHARLAEPFAVLLFVLVAIPLGARVERGAGRGMTLPALYGIATVTCFFGLRTLAETLTVSGLLPPASTPWALLAGFFAFGGWRLFEMPA